MPASRPRIMFENDGRHPLIYMNFHRAFVDSDLGSYERTSS